MLPAPSYSVTIKDARRKTALGEPDLRGIWTDETDTSLQRPAKYANQEFFTEAQRGQLDRERSQVLGRDKRGLVTRRNGTVSIPEEARPFVRTVCAVFDSYFTGVRPSLRSPGIEIVFSREGRADTRAISMNWSVERTARTVSPSAAR